MEIFDHIKFYSNRINIHIDCIGGFDDHCHILFQLNKNQSIAKTMMLLKGESSYWINHKKFQTDKFMWQDDYWATGIGLSEIKRIQNYIANQEVHHQKISFDDEIRILEKHYRFLIV